MDKVTTIYAGRSTLKGITYLGCICPEAIFWIVGGSQWNFDLCQLWIGYTTSHVFDE